MNRFNFKAGDTGWLKRTGVILLLAALLLTAYSSAIPLAHAQESDAPAATPPAGDCWGGVLSDDPLHCYALEEAQRDGVIVVEGLYLVGNELRVYFRFASDSTTYFALPDILRANAREFAIQHPGRVTYNFGDHRCSGGDGEASFRDCILDYTFTSEGPIFPWDSSYDVITFHTGGAKGRKQAAGWASWRQLWPADSPGATGTSGTFDVSDVDTTNFPEIECAPPNQTQSCAQYTDHPDWGIAGIHAGGGRKTYVQVKAIKGEEAAAEAALRAKMKQSGIKVAYDANRIIVIPVKYDYKQFWQWSVVLDRFAISSSNTIGITGAHVGENGGGYEVTIFPLNDLQDAGENTSSLRETIHVWAIDPQRVVDALPTLLPLLGIPIDAVGVVGRVHGLRAELIQPQPLAGAPSQAEDAPSGLTNSPKNALEDAGEETGNGAHDATTNLGTATAQDTMRGETTQSVGKSASDGVDVGDTVRLLPYPDTIQDIDEEAPQVAKLRADDGASAWLIAGASGAVGLVILTSAMYLTAVMRRRRA